MAAMANSRAKKGGQFPIFRAAPAKWRRGGREKRKLSPIACPNETGAPFLGRPGGDFESYFRSYFERTQAHFWWPCSMTQSNFTQTGVWVAWPWCFGVWWVT